MTVLPAWSYFLMSSLLWIFILLLPPGPKTVTSSYRLNFTQGIISSLFTILSLLQYLPETITTMTCASYFTIDLFNKIINDYYYQLPSKQRGLIRGIDYFHHFLSLLVIFYAHFYYEEICLSEQEGHHGHHHNDHLILVKQTVNPVLKITLAELSTPFLVAWRQTGDDILAILFVIIFFLVRIVYQGFFLMPDIMRKCSSQWVIGFSLLYMILNACFFFMIIKKVWRAYQKSTILAASSSSGRPSEGGEGKDEIQSVPSPTVVVVRGSGVEMEKVKTT